MMIKNNAADPELMASLKQAKADMELRVAGYDQQETKERVDAARAYAGENEKHFVDYAQDCIDQSNRANREIRRVQADCWNVFKEKEPASYRNKAPWQSRIVVPKPYAAVMYGAASIKKAFSPDFLSISDENNPYVEDLWRTILLNQTNKEYANLPQKFTDASIMALAVGQGMEIIPTYVSGRGLRYDLVEPWKIARDPDAPPRDAQGGLYWIHQEWLDYFVLRRGQADGKYRNVEKAKAVSGHADPKDPFMTKRAIAERKEQIWSRSKFRTMILTSEFWGAVLSPKGEMLLPTASYTVAGGRVIELPRAVPYKRMRWPGVSWSPMPDLLTHGGRGLLEGIISIWEAMCNLMCLHEDALKWVVNPPTEINVNGLVDPLDIDDWPGKKFLVKSTPSGNQVVRTIDRRDSTGSILANMQYHDQNFQRGSLITDAVQGLPGYRKDITAKEAAQNLEQSMGVFGLMGSNMEDGAIALLHATQDVIESFASIEDFKDILNPETLMWVVQQGGGFPALTGSYSVSGVQSLMKDREIMKIITTIIAPLASDPKYAPYMNPYKILKVIERRTNLKDEGVIVDEQTAKQIDAAIMALRQQQPPAGTGGNTP